MRPAITPPEFHDWKMSDGYVVRGRVWPPTGQERSRIIIYLHGIQSHGGWFEWSASLLAEQGCAVILPDRRGSGLNDAARGDVPSVERWLSDIDELAAWGQREFSAARVDLVGVSWGAKLALAWALRHKDGPRRLLLVGPGLFPAVDVGLWTRARIGLSLLAGGDRTYAIPLDDPNLFTDNPAGQDFIAGDRLKLTRATARFFWHSRRLDQRLLRAPDRALRDKTTLVLAERDRIIRNRPTEARIRRVMAEQLQVVTFPEAFHTLEFSADPAGFREVVAGWASNKFEAAS